MNPEQLLVSKADLQQRPATIGKKENLKQRAYLNSLSAIIDYAGIQVTGFIINPFIVGGLGTSMYGVWQMLGQLTGYTKMVDTRATQVLKWSLANKRDVALEEELKSDLTTAFVVTAITLPFALIIGSILSWYAPVITQASAEYYSLVRITCGILILGLIINKYFDLFEAVLAGMNMGYKRMGFRAVIVAFGGLLKVLAITNGYGLIGLSIVQIIVSLITGLTFLHIVKKHVPWFAFGKTNFSKIKSFGKLSGWFMAFSTLKMLLLNSDKILLGFIAGPVLVAKYALTMFTSSAVQGSMIAVITGMTPGICTLFGKGEYDKVKKARKSIIILTWLFSSAVGTTLLFLNKSFIGLWVGIENYAGNLENLFILIISVQVIFFQLDGLIINATLDMKNKVFLSACASVVTIILSFILVPHYQVIGICISIFIGRLFYSIGFPYLLKQRMNDKSPFLSFEAIKRFFLTVLLYCLATYAGKSVTISNWITLLAIGLIVLALSSMFFWFVGMRHNERLETIKTLSGIKLLKMK
ncbi:MAG: polysaccharide biosynthesis protein [Bacteroidota bacterium]